jgi:hypothetical protein
VNKERHLATQAWNNKSAAKSVALSIDAADVDGKEKIMSTSLTQSTSLSHNLPEVLKSVRTRPLFLLREAVPPLLVVGKTPNAFRRIGVITGGVFEGERLSGQVVTGNDWQNVRDDSCIKLDVRLILKTTDGELIVMTYQCLRAGTPEVMQRLDKGESVDPTQFYFRMNPMFETSSKKYDWMNRIITVGIGHRPPDGPIYSIFEIL